MNKSVDILENENKHLSTIESCFKGIWNVEVVHLTSTDSPYLIEESAQTFKGKISIVVTDPTQL